MRKFRDVVAVGAYALRVAVFVVRGRAQQSNSVRETRTRGGLLLYCVDARQCPVMRVFLVQRARALNILIYVASCAGVL